MKAYFAITKSTLWGLLMLAGHTAFAQTSVRPIPTLGGSMFTGTALNNAGQLAGYSTTSGDVAQHAFLFSGENTADLGTLGGSFSQAYALNDQGQVVGMATTSNEEFHAFVFQGGSMTDLGTLGGSFSLANAINNAGDIVGQSGTANGLAHAFLFRGGVMHDLGTLGGQFSTAIAVNTSGDVAGNSDTAGFSSHAFWYRNGLMTDLLSLGGGYSQAAALNNRGEIAGESSTSSQHIHAFWYHNGALEDLQTLGGTYSTAYALNDASEVIGDSATANDREYHGFVYRNGAMQDLGTLGGSYSTASAINNAGQIVGDSATANGRSHAFLYQNGQMTDLNQMLPPDSGWELFSAFFINDSGQIVGFADHEGQFTWYLLTLGSQTQNQPPVAEAGPDLAAECDHGQATVQLDGTQSTDPNGDSLDYQWREGTTLLGTGAVLEVGFPTGIHQVTLTVTDPSGASAEDTLVVQVADTQAPALSAPAPVTLAAESQCQTLIPDLRGQCQLNDGCADSGQLTLTQSPAPGTVVGLGQHLITFTATDPAGNSSSATTSVTVADLTPPTIQTLSVNPAILTPPNNKMVPVTVTLEAIDQCDPAPSSKIISVSSSDPVTGPGDNTTPDWVITGDLSLELRAERGPKSEGRIYTITIKVTDASGNYTVATVCVTVDKSKKN